MDMSSNVIMYRIHAMRTPSCVYSATSRIGKRGTRREEESCICHHAVLSCNVYNVSCYIHSYIYGFVGNMKHIYIYI